MKKYLLLIATLLILFSCKKEQEIVYQLNEVNVSQSSSNKDKLKTTMEFIAIAYTDIFGSSIAQNELQNLTITYNAFGDKKLIEEMVIKNFLNVAAANLPAIDRTSTATINRFVEDTYKKLYNREPNEYESWYMTDFIEKDNDVNSELFYYALMTANEYRYY